MRAMRGNFEAVGMAGALNFLPWLKYAPGDLFKYHTAIHNEALLDKFITHSIQTHKATFNPDTLRDYIDAYIQEMRDRQVEDSNTSFDDLHLVKVVSELFLAGTQTTAISLLLVLLYMLNYPEVQQKVRDEIHSVIDSHRLPSMTDRPNLPYTEATLLEVMRQADLLPLGFGHASSVDTTLAGYFVPKGTLIMPILTSALNDPDVFPDPESFNPGRFLDSAGNVQKPEEFIPFSAGKRGCIGESLAKMEVFLFATAILQRFVIKVPEGVSKPTMESTIGLVRLPHSYELCAVVEYN